MSFLLFLLLLLRKKLGPRLGINFSRWRKSEMHQAAVTQAFLVYIIDLFSILGNFTSVLWMITRVMSNISNPSFI